MGWNRSTVFSFWSRIWRCCREANLIKRAGGQEILRWHLVILCWLSPQSRCFCLIPPLRHRRMLLVWTVSHWGTIPQCKTWSMLEKEMKSMFPVLLFIFSAAFAIKKTWFPGKDLKTAAVMKMVLRCSVRSAWFRLFFEKHNLKLDKMTKWES